MISTRTIAITGLLAALTLGGCTSTTNRTTPTAPAIRTTDATPPTPPADYPTARQLADALNNAGIPCTNWEPVDNPLTALDSVLRHHHHLPAHRPAIRRRTGQHPRITTRA